VNNPPAAIALYGAIAGGGALVVVQSTATGVVPPSLNRPMTMYWAVVPGLRRMRVSGEISIATRFGGGVAIVISACPAIAVPVAVAVTW
jgi:hypothetical protein